MFNFNDSLNECYPGEFAIARICLLPSVRSECFRPASSQKSFALPFFLLARLFANTELALLGIACNRSSAQTRSSGYFKKRTTVPLSIDCKGTRAFNLLMKLNKNKRQRKEMKREIKTAYNRVLLRKKAGKE